MLELLRTQTALLYSVRNDGASASLTNSTFTGHGADQATSLGAGLDAWIRRSSGAWAYFDPRSPEPAQRNVVVRLGTMRTLADRSVPQLLERSGVPMEEQDRRASSIAGAMPWFRQWGTVDAFQMRALVCDGPALVAWVGALQADPFDARAQRLLAAALPSLTRRLLADARFSGSAAQALVPAVLEELASAAFVLDAKSRVVACNSLGAARLAAEPTVEPRRLAEARGAGGDARYSSVDLRSRGVPGHALVIEHQAPGLPAAAIDTARSRFGWTKREAEVVAGVVRGRTNRSLAVEFGCSERTIESHMSRVLAKSDCPSRSALAALVWALPGR